MLTTVPNTNKNMYTDTNTNTNDNQPLTIASIKHTKDNTVKYKNKYKWWFVLTITSIWWYLPPDNLPPDNLNLVMGSVKLYDAKVFSGVPYKWSLVPEKPPFVVLNSSEVCHWKPSFVLHCWSVLVTSGQWSMLLNAGQCWLPVVTPQSRSMA